MASLLFSRTTVAYFWQDVPMCKGHALRLTEKVAYLR